MDKTSYEEINRGKRNLVILTLVVLTVIGLIIGLFTNYKYETLICNKINDICYVQKTNMLNTKTKKDLIAVSDIKYMTYIPKTVPGNAYASGYTVYYLAFGTKWGKPVSIFSTEYYDKNEVEAVVADLNAKLKNGNIKVVKMMRKL
ncbi:MAG: hypothetical protein SPL73_00195 [Cyanobacteriota bacterium]|nr:hypothetical protein [Cyanobacteriota bacterium]MDY6358385.1 hypothetical protein [Cyanobacteriota bacterium]MDY6363292.1 hypothetical protein [Cyanobacteriota bacterium]MDY6383718.1 hypothetical protein [Cyanobacteriota bacterium]